MRKTTYHFPLIASLLALLAVGCSPNTELSPTPTSAPPEPVTTTNTVNGDHRVTLATPGANTPMVESPPAPSVIASSDGLCVILEYDDMDVTQLEGALACVITYFDWPERYQVDLTKVNAQLRRNDPTYYEPGREFTFAQGWYACAWYAVWLDARREGNTAGEAAALTVITERIPNMPTLVPYFPDNVWGPGVREHYQDIATKAQLNDPSGVQDFVTHICHFMDQYWSD